MGSNYFFYDKLLKRGKMWDLLSNFLVRYFWLIPALPVLLLLDKLGICPLVDGELHGCKSCFMILCMLISVTEWILAITLGAIFGWWVFILWAVFVFVLNLM